MKPLRILFIIIIATIVSCSSGSKEISRVPGWAKEAVWYQIFPERFNNGDKFNDPTVDDVVNIWPYIQPNGWQVHPWTSDWFKLQPWEADLNFGFYQIQGLRRYGGDLHGVLDKLDYLNDLGINAIYFNPLFESPSLHKYDAKMFRHIDNNFGPDPEKDEMIWNNENPVDPKSWQWTTADSLFLKLIDECHKRNIKLIIDGVFNHVGTHFWAFNDVVENQDKSKYADWFTVKSWDNPETPENEFDYAGWIGVKDLPELKEDENGLIAPIKEHVFNVVKRWMDPNNDGDPSDGIDGWRLDVAEMVNIKFWKEFRTYVKSINPDAYITGEVWWEDWQKNKMFDASPWLQGDAFDAVMNYRFARGLRHYILRTEDAITSQGLIDTLQQIKNDYNKENLYVLMNLMDSHDVDRLASQVNNPNEWYDHNANPGQNSTYDVGAPDEQGRMKQKLIIGMQMTMPGAPMIYYGDEAGMWGGDDPDCRKPMIWSEYTYEDEVTDPLGRERNPDKVLFDAGLYGWYKKMINIRTGNKVLSHGDIILNAISDNVLSYIRTNEDAAIYIFVNKSNKPETINIDGKLNEMKMNYNDLVSNQKYDFSAGNTIELNPYQIIILE